MGGFFRDTPPPERPLHFHFEYASNNETTDVAFCQRPHTHTMICMHSVT